MKIEHKYEGKWIAIKSCREVVAAASSLSALEKKIEKRADLKKLSYSLVPKSPFIGLV